MWLFWGSGLVLGVFGGGVEVILGMKKPAGGSGLLGEGVFLVGLGILWMIFCGGGDVICGGLFVFCGGE